MREIGKNLRFLCLYLIAELQLLLLRLIILHVLSALVVQRVLVLVRFLDNCIDPRQLLAELFGPRGEAA